MLTQDKDFDKTLDSLTRDPIFLAMSVLRERIKDLGEEDKADLYELVKAFVLAIKEGDEEGMRSAERGMLEIMEQTPSAVVRIPPDDASVKNLDGWVNWISAKIKELRSAAGLTQQALAERTGLPQSHISRLEKGQHSPSFATLEKLASAFGVPVSVLDPSQPEAGEQ